MHTLQLVSSTQGPGHRTVPLTKRKTRHILGFPWGVQRSRQGEEMYTGFAGLAKISGPLC